jgi:hypothetical protein
VGGKYGGKVGIGDLDHEVEISALDESRHADARQGGQHLYRPPRGVVVIVRLQKLHDKASRGIYCSKRMGERWITSIMSAASRAVALSQPVMSCWRKQPWGKESWVNTVACVRLRLRCRLQALGAGVCKQGIKGM